MKLLILFMCYFFATSGSIVALAVWRELCSNPQPVIIKPAATQKRKTSKRKS